MIYFITIDYNTYALSPNKDHLERVRRRRECLGHAVPNKVKILKIPSELPPCAEVVYYESRE